jgi:hypothetical protein
LALPPASKSIEVGTVWVFEASGMHVPQKSSTCLRHLSAADPLLLSAALSLADCCCLQARLLLLPTWQRWRHSCCSRTKASRCVCLQLLLHSRELDRTLRMLAAAVLLLCYISSRTAPSRYACVPVVVVAVQRVKQNAVYACCCCAAVVLHQQQNRAYV